LRALEGAVGRRPGTWGGRGVERWTIRDGWLAPKAAGTIHTDFERGFIKAEVYNWKDWKANDCSEAAVKEGGKYPLRSGGAKRCVAGA